MSQDVRQNNLFAAENFTKVYKSFKNVNFQAYDYDTLKQAMIDYLKLHYPEDFNDYIESSEYVAMIELLAYLGTSLAFRMDLNSRENLMDTAERRESVIRLARMINYQPKRNLAAHGVFKITGIQTSESITDSLGRNLANTTVFWNDPNNQDSYDQFITIANAAFVTSNPFGKPYKRGTLGSIPTDLYQLDNVKNIQVSYPVTINVNDDQLPFDIANVDFNNNESFFERHPDPANAMNIIYRNDGQGLSSANTGFFLYFKQGSLLNIDNRFDFPIKDRLTEIDVKNINNTDVYVQEIDEDGNVQVKWTSVPSIVGNENVYFNPVSPDVRTIYGIVTGQDDKITLQFADGNFADVPTGIFRTWVRASANKNFNLRPDEAQNLEVIIPYVGKDTQEYNLRLIFSLQESVSNSAPSETNEEIKNRSPQVYYTQDRMVNNEDYNVFPLSRGNEIAKIRTTNRTNAGHSRYIDINDPTGFHQNLLLLSDDGALFRDNQIPFDVVEINNEVDEERIIVTTTLEGFLRDRQITNFFYDNYLEEYRRYMGLTTQFTTFGSTYNRYNVYDFLGSYHWQTSPDATKNNTGYLINTTTSVVYNNNNKTPTEAQHGWFALFSKGCKVKFSPSNSSTEFRWATVSSVASGTGDTDVDGKLITFDVEISRSWTIQEIIPKFRRDFTTTEIDSISDELFRRNNFGVKYDANLDAWVTFDNPSDSPVFALDDLARSWVFTATYTLSTGSYEFRSRGTRYIFESYRDVRFFFDTTQQKNFDVADLSSDLDEIEILDTNHQINDVERWQFNGATNMWVNVNNTSVVYPAELILLKNRTIDDQTAYVTLGHPPNNLPVDTNPSINVLPGVVTIASNYANDGDLITVRYSDNNTPLNTPAKWNLFNPVFETDGYLNPAKVEVIAADGDKDGIPDEPLLFSRVVGDDQLTFEETHIDLSGNETRRLWSSRWVDIRRQVVNNTVIPYVGVSFDDLVTQDLFLVLDNDKAGFKDTVNYRTADAIMSGNNIAELEASLAAIEGGSTFVERVDSGQIVVDTIPNGDGATDFEPMMSFVADSDAVTDLTVMKADGGWWDTTIQPLPSFNVVDWQDAAQRDLAISEMISKDLLPEVFSFPKDTNHFVRNGRSFTLNTNSDNPQPLDYKWRHYAPADHRIDPSISNIMDMIVLTNTYYKNVLRWKDSGSPVQDFPKPPTTENLRVQFGELNEYKMLSDQIIFAPAKFKVMFGPTAAPELQALFNVVKVPTTLLTDNEIKSKVVEAIDEFFDITTWGFGETFYFTELAAYIHKQLAGTIGSIVLVPTYRESQFGDLFQVPTEPNELFISTATVANVGIVNSLTETNMRL